MKIATKIAGFLMSCLTLCASLQPVATMAQNTEMARPRSTIDLSRTDRLTGTPNPQETPLSCPSGQVYSGGTCVLISNQNTGVQSWTKPFIGQSRTASNQGHHGYGSVFTINGDGSLTGYLTAAVNGSRNEYLPTPPGLNAVAFGRSVGFCNSVSFTAYPIYTNSEALNGLPPHDWAVSNLGNANSTPSECGF